MAEAASDGCASRVGPWSMATQGTPGARSLCTAGRSPRRGGVLRTDSAPS
jgi:hypothetical protein